MKSSALIWLGAIIVLPLFIWGSLALVHWTSRAESAERFPPSAVFADLGSLATSATTKSKMLQSSPGEAALVTARRVLACSFLSTVLGLIFGIVLGLWRTGAQLLSPSIEFIRALPVTFVLPLVTHSVGITGASMPWVLASIPCTLIVCIAVSRGIGAVAEERRACVVAFVGEKNYLRLIRHFYLPITSASLATGIKLAVPYAVVLVGVLEYIGVGGEDRGLGYVISLADGRGIESQQFASIIAYGLFGLALVSILTFVESKIHPWKNSS